MHYLIYHQPFEKFTLSSLLVQYHSAVIDNALGIVENPLVFYEQILTTIDKICRIIVPASLRHTIFSLLYTSLAAGLMGEYKILYQIAFLLAKDEI